MVVVLLVVVAAILLGHGYLTESRDEVIAAGVLSLGAAALVIVDRVRARIGTAGEGEAAADEPGERHAANEPAEPDEADESDDPGDRVVFVPGRTTFHRPGCAAVADKQTSAAERAELELGGMQPCRRCIPAGPGTSDGRTLRLA